MNDDLAARVSALISSEDGPTMAQMMASVSAKGWDHLANTPQAQFEAEAIRIGLPPNRAAEMARLPTQERSMVLTELAQVYRKMAAETASA